MDNATIGAPTTLRLWHRFKASPDRVFQAWTRPDALRQWWCPDGWQPAEIDVDLRVGGRYRFAMSRPGEGRYVAVHGCFLDVQPGSRLVYTWQWDGAFTDMGETQVKVEFRSVDGGTDLFLWQDVPDLSYCTRHLGGWTGACQRIAMLLADGD